MILRGTDRYNGEERVEEGGKGSEDVLVVKRIRAVKREKEKEPGERKGRTKGLEQLGVPQMVFICVQMSPLLPPPARSIVCFAPSPNVNGVSAIPLGKDNREVHSV